MPFRWWASVTGGPHALCRVTIDAGVDENLCYDSTFCCRHHYKINLLLPRISLIIHVILNPSNAELFVFNPLTAGATYIRIFIISTLSTPF